LFPIGDEIPEAKIIIALITVRAINNK